MTPRRTIIFTLPTSTAGQQGPVAAWLNTAGWAAAAEESGFQPMIITPHGQLDIETLRSSATQHTTEADRRSSSLLSRLPTTMKVALKDVREALRARAFTRLVAACSLPEEQVAFVWQRHELFHTAGARLARRLRRPFVLYVVAPKAWEARTWGVHRPGWGRIAERFGDSAILRQADVVACVSEEVSEAVQRLGVQPHRILVTPSTVNTDLFHPSADGTAARQRLGISDRFVMGWTGSFRNFHGLDTLLEAMALIKDEIPEALLLLVGDGPERKRLAASVDQRGLSHWVQFVGTVGQEELPAIIAACDIAMLLGRAGRSFHYSPLKLWEYLAMARPVIVSADGSALRALTDGVNAVLVPPERVAAIVDSVTLLRSDPQLRERLGVEGRRLAETMSWTHQLDKVRSRLEELFSGSGTTT